MQELNLRVTNDEANLILEGLGQMPFAKVYEVIGKIQEQASRQLNGQDVRAAGGAPATPGPPVKENSDE
jgi:hypothetical protein